MMLYLVLHTSSTMGADPAPSHNKKKVCRFRNIVQVHQLLRLPHKMISRDACQGFFNVLCHVDETVSKSCSVTTLFVNEKTYDICVVPPYSSTSFHNFRF